MSRRKLSLSFLILLIPVGGYAWFHVKAGKPPITASAKTQPESSKYSDAAALLERKLEAGTAKLEYEPRHGYLRSLLRNLNIPESSQCLVFSKSSFQYDHISPETPRALYFNDDVYVGYVPTGRLFEITAIDPIAGPVFYTLDRDQSEHPKIENQSQTRNCIVCHDASNNDNPIPRLLMLSVLPDAKGNSLHRLSLLTNDKSPLNERWGGWYVSGTHGAQRHLGNMIIRAQIPDIESMKEYIPKLDLNPGANITDLSGIFNTRPYPNPNSDIVALMLLGHQTHIHNLVTLADYEVRDAMEHHPENTEKLVKEDGELLVEAMLFSGAAKFSAPITGTSGFSEEFSKQGKQDSHGRSLKDLDLKTRLMKYPMSYVIYSESFDRMVAPVKEFAYRRFREILNGQDKSSSFSHLSAVDRENILGILRETKPEFAATLN
jgi:hypothetical protein